MADYPDEVQLFKLVGRIGRGVGDTIDVNSDADLLPLVGAKVICTPNLKTAEGGPVYRSPSSTPPVTIFQETIVGTTDNDGNLVAALIGVGGAITPVIPASMGVSLPFGGSPEIIPTGWTWTITISVGGNFPDRSFVVFGGDGTVLDVSTLIPVPESPGTDVAAWQVIVNQATDAAADARASLAALPELVIPAVADALSKNATIAAAAVDAIQDAATGLDLVEKSDLGVGDTITNSDYLAYEAYVNPATGEEIVTRTVSAADGTTWVALADNVSVPTTKLTGAVETFDDPDFAVSYEFAGGLQSYGVTHNGELLVGGKSIQDLVQDAINGPAKRTAVIHMFGQSNGYYGMPTSGYVDPGVIPGVFEWPNTQYSAIYGKAIPAQNPLHFFTQAPGRVSYAMELAKQYLAENPTHNVLIVPTNQAGVGYSTSPNSIAPGGSVRNAAFKMFADSLKNTPNSFALAFIYSQGEAEAAPLSGQIASGAFSALMDGVVTEYRALYPNVPLIVTQMQPGWVDAPASNSPSRHIVDQELIQTPRRWKNSAFVPGPVKANPTGTYSYLNNDGETIHFNADAHTITGQRIFRAIKAALGNIAGSAPAPVKNIAALGFSPVSANSYEFVWDAPASEYVGFDISWVDATGVTQYAFTQRDPMFPGCTVTTTGTPRSITVATVSNQGSSAPVTLTVGATA